MDSMTHIYFAGNLLRVAELSYDAIDGALFPQIDRKPAYYHRLYAHSIPRAESIAEAARDVYWDESATPSPEDYLRSRLVADRDRIRSYASGAPFSRNVERVPATVEIALAIVSHIYNDQFNNPIQAFVPYSVYPSGAWDLWKSIDSAEFRWHLYEKNTIDRFRQEVFAGTEWATRLPAEALLAAMIARLAEASPVKIEAEVVKTALKSVHAEEAYRTGQFKDANEVLAEHDRRIMALIETHSRPSSQEGPRKWAGHGY